MKNNTNNARSTLLSLGVSEIKATLALQQIQLSPRSSDPDAASTAVLVKAVQRGMNQIGCTLIESGRMDLATAKCIRRALGPHWESKSWLDITKDIVLLRYSKFKLTGPMAVGGQSLGAVPAASQIGGLVILAGVVFFALKYK